MEHPTGKSPKSVTIIGCGPTRKDYLDILASPTPNIGTDEIWGVNTATNFCSVDVIFMIDDYVAIKGHLPYLQKIYESTTIPIITSVKRKDCPTAIDFPLSEVLAMNPNRDYLNHTLPFMVAYAALIGVKELIIFGADYIDPTVPYPHGKIHADKPQRYMGCMSYWIGFAEARGMKVSVSPNSPLLDSDYTWEDKFYGYLIKPVVRREGDPVPEVKDEEPPTPKLVVNEE